MALTLRTVAVALVGVAVVFLAPMLAVGLDAAFAVAVLADLALAAPTTSLQLSRDGATTVRLGERTGHSLLLHNTGRRPARGCLRDGWVPSAGADPRVLRFAVGAGERRRLEMELGPTRRGERRTDRITLRSLGPLGLAGRQRRRLLPGTLTVLPMFPSRRLLAGKLVRLRVVDGLVAARGAGQGTEVDALRDYAVGDDARAVDWRASARHGGVVVRTYRPERDRRVLLALDTGRTCAARIGDTPRLDHSLDAALLLAALALRAGDRVGLLGYDAVLRAEVVPGRRIAPLADAMTPLEPVLVDTDHRALAGRVLRRGSGTGLLVLFTDLAPVVVEESLLPVLGALTRHHRVLVAAVADPALSAWADAGHGGVTQAYRAAAAARALLERAALAATLRRAGAQVIDAAPAALASAVADGYLALKAAGRL